MKKLHFSLLLLSIVIMSSCARVVPVTNRIIERVGGAEQLDKFQYYVSKKIKLERTQKNSNAGVIRGKANVVDYTLEDRVIIRKATPGVVINSRYDGSYLSDTLDASFADSDNRFLSFSNFGSRSYDAPYYLVSLESKRTGYPGGSNVNYDNWVYQYEVSGKTPLNKILSKFNKNKSIGEPKLLIKLKKKDYVEKKRRREKGRRIDL